MNGQFNGFPAASAWSFQPSTAISRKILPSEFGSPGPSRGYYATPHVPSEALNHRPPTSVTHGSMGYFAFLPSSLPTSSPGIPDGETHKSGQNDTGVRQKQEIEAEQASIWESRLQKEAENRQEQLAREECEARRGEEEWVRSGGILRDVEGRRDVVKTQAVRDELKLREVEAQLVQRWEEYERKWKELSAAGTSGTTTSVTFCDIPWPVDVETRETLNLCDLTVEKVEEFLLGGLKVRSNRVTKRDRIRSSFLRWHPDKMTVVLARVVDEDMEAVKQGVTVVMMCLQELNAKL